MNARTRTTIGASLFALLVTSSCGGDDPETSPPPETTDAAAQDYEAADMFENIPDDAPIHDMDEDDLFRHMFDCDDDQTIEECEQAYQDEVDEGVLAYAIEECTEMIAEYEETGFNWMSCRGASMPNEEFYALYEDETGVAVPDDLRTEDVTEEEMAEFENKLSGGSDCDQIEQEWAELNEEWMEAADDPAQDESRFSDDLLEVESTLESEGCW